MVLRQVDVLFTSTNNFLLFSDDAADCHEEGRYPNPEQKNNLQEQEEEVSPSSGPH